MIIPKGTILFQGDSITDADRDRADPAGLGNGYVMMAAPRVNSQCPGAGFSYLNRGVSGNTVRDLKGRWERDCIALKPDLVSILIGINDTWNRYRADVTVLPREFETDYRHILDRTRKETDAEIMLLEPFILPCPADRESWREDLNPKIHIVNALAEKYGVPVVRLDGVFRELSHNQKPEHWAEDGIHPTPEGHSAIADAWVKVFMENGA
jgi:lysophospholipase L1-like esterase